MINRENLKFLLAAVVVMIVMAIIFSLKKDDVEIDGRAQLRQVTLAYEDGSQSSYIMTEDDVDLFVEASKKLHYNPGINPHSRHNEYNKDTTAEVVDIWVSHLDEGMAYWWSTPNLGVDDSPDQREGAVIMDWRTDYHVSLP